MAPNALKSQGSILAVLKAKIKIKNPQIRAGIGPKPTTPLGKWHSGPSPGTPGGGGAKNKHKNNFKHSQAMSVNFTNTAISLCEN